MGVILASASLASVLAGLLLSLGYRSALRSDEAPVWPVWRDFTKSLARPEGWPWLHLLAGRAQIETSFPPRRARFIAEGVGFVAGAAWAWYLGPNGVPPPLAMAALLAVALAISIVDWSFLILPDELHVAIMIPVLLLMVAGLWPKALALAAAGLLLIAGLLLALGYSRLRGKDMMGMGDVKLMAASGLWLTPDQIPLYMIVAGLSGVCLNLLWRRLGKGEASPFGPALILALLVCVFLHGRSFF